MISINAYGGLSASQLLALFKTNSSSAASASSNATSTDSASSSPTGAVASNGNDPTSAIKAILAEAQITHVSASGGWTVAQAETAYADQTQTSGMVPSTDDLTSGTINFLSESDAYASLNTSTGQAGYAGSQHFGYQDFTLDKSSSVVATTSGSPPDMTSAQASSPNSGAISTGADAANPASSADYIQLSASMGFQSANESLGLKLSLGFSVAGLGALTALPDSNVLQAHAVDADHDYTDFFQINEVLNGEMNGVNVNIQGLDATQAQDIVTAFQKAAADDGIAQNTGQGYNSNFSVFYGGGSFISDSELAQGQT